MNVRWSQLAKLVLSIIMIVGSVWFVFFGLILQPHLLIREPQAFQTAFVMTALCSCLVPSSPE
jgi:hypothetical protein